MNKIKDFIYDKNDVIIAALIIIVAALIIAWRMNVILQYPKELITPGSDIQTEMPIDEQGSGSDADSDTAGSGSDSGSNAEADDDSSLPQTPAELWADGKLTQDVEVTVDGATAAAAIQCLIDKELFTDYSEYQSLCDTLGLNHEKVSAGSFTFEKGSTKEQIAKKVNWS